MTQSLTTSLTPDQISAIQEWAREAQHVRCVRLLGSRARGLAKPESDVDLALTVAPDASAGTIRSHWNALAQAWQSQLSSILRPLKAHLLLYNDPDQDLVREACAEYSVVLYARTA